MSLRQEIAEAQRAAQKERDELKLSILRVLSSAIKNLEIDKKRELSDEEVSGVISSQVKQLNDALKDFITGNREDLIQKTEKEIRLLQAYLPEQMSDSELRLQIEKIINNIAAKGPADLGKVMGLAMKEVKGRADGTRVREMVLKILSA